jgi:hypothetical protein
MIGRRRKLAVRSGDGGMRRKAAALIATAIPFLLAAPAGAATGYELSTTTPTLNTGAELQHGLAIDQTSDAIYVAVIGRGGTQLGEIRRLTQAGAVTGSFAAASNPVFSGVAVNPATQAFYGAEVRIRTPFGDFGTPRLHVFSSAGVAGGTFATSDTEAGPQIAADSAGRIYFPNAVTNSVQVFNPAGTLLETISCAGCPGGTFGTPVSVALEPDGDLYVVDTFPNRVVKLVNGGGGYAYASTLQSGRDAAGVAVNPSNGDVFVSNVPSANDHHIVAYDSSGVEFDDFGAGLATLAFPELGTLLGPQLAVDATSHKLYLGSKSQLFVFDRVTITPPTVTTDPPSSVGQLVATLRATVNAKGHAVLTCKFEYVDDAEFLAEGFANPSTAACSSKPDGTASVVVSGGATGLSPATKYHVRAVATSHAGTTTGGTQTFTTLPSVPPTVTTDSATGVTETAATLVGRVNPRGGNVSDCHFDYGTTSSYGSSVSCAPKPGPVNTEVTSKGNLKGLPSGTTYHYRLVVTTNAGTDEGDDMTFTTASPPPPPPPPPPPTTDPAPPPATEPPPPTTPTTTACKPGFVKVRSGGKVTCVKRCRKGFVRKKVRGKFRCVRQQPRRRAAQR